MTTLTKRVMLLFIAVISSTVLTFAPLMQPTASAASDNPVEQLERWFYYRGMRACFEKPWFGDGLTDGSDNEDISVSEINDGHLKIKDWTTGGAKKEGFGYLGPDMDGANGNDGTVDCTDGSIFVRGASAFGFGSVLELICAMNRTLPEGEGGRIEPSHPTDCEQSDEIHFDGGDSAFQTALTKALEQYGDKDRPDIELNENDGTDYDAKALYYLLGKRSLEIFCGKNAPIETASEDNDSYDGDDDIVSVHVVQADGTIKKSQSYPLANPDRDESSNVNDVYWKVGGNWNEADDVSCAKMAQWTRDPGNAEAFAAYIRLHPDDFDRGNEDGGEGGSTGPVCSAGALGWVFCPLVDFISSATQDIAELIEGQLVYPALLNREVPEGRAIQAIWGVVLGIANVALVIAFLIVIFSQATSVGISAYGIKRMLPRVIAAAILMNLSFYICAAAVDIANIVGVSIKDIVGGGMDIISDIEPSSNVQNGASDAQTWSAAIVGILGLGLAVATGAIFLLLPVIVAALMAVLTALLVIAARQVIVTLLIIVAPLAILAWILPNTEQWFTKWRKLFTAMLMMFPLVMLIFYGSLLMSKLIMVTGSPGGDGDPEVMTNIIALAVLTVPLFSLPFIMKSAGGVLDRLGVLVNNRNKGLVDRTRNKANEWKGNSTYQRGKAVRKQISNDYKGTRFAKRVNKGGLAGTVAGGVAGNMGRVPALNNTVFGAQHTRMNEATTAAEAEAFEKRVQAKMKYHTIRNTGFDDLGSNFRTALKNNDQEEAVAMLRQLGSLGSGGRQRVDDMMRGTVRDAQGNVTSQGTGITINDEAMRNKIDNTVSKDMYGSLVGSRGDVAKGKFDSATNTWKSGKMSDLGDEQLATQDSKTLALNEHTIDAAAAYRVTNDSNLRSKIQDKEAMAILTRAASTYTPPASGNQGPSGSTGGGGGAGPIITPPSSGNPSGGNPPQPGSVQQQRQQGGNFNSGPGQNLPPANP